MTYLLDTNAAIALIKGKPAAVRTRLEKAMAKEVFVAVSSIVLFELWYGVARSERQHENAERLRIFLSGSIEVVHFEDQDAVTAGELRATLDKAGTPIGPYDVLIAAQALRMNATLITANVSEFSRVKSLKWQDWGIKGA